MSLEIVGIKDPGRLLEWRMEVIRAVFGVEPGEALAEANRRYYASHTADGSHRAFMAVADGEEAGCGAICLQSELPSPDNPSGLCAYLMNIYVRPGYRSRGIGHAIVRCLVDEARRAGCGKIYLETTAEARTLYSGMGFREMKGMMKYADI